MTPGRRLVVTGDDFGLSPEVNGGIARAHREGILRATSLMVAAPAAAGAVAVARTTPTLAVGLHLVLVNGRASAPATAHAGLAAPDGALPRTPMPAALRWFLSPRLRAAVRIEIAAQMRAFAATGLALSHVDGHLHVHLHPVAQHALADLLPAHPIPALRLTRDPLVPALRRDRRGAVRKTFEAAALGALSALARRRFRNRGIVFADRVLGLHESGGCNEPTLARLLDGLPRGVTEIYTHPAAARPAAARADDPGLDREAELAALVSPAIRRLIAERGIDLVTWADLRGEGGGA